MLDAPATQDNTIRMVKFAYLVALHLQVETMLVKVAQLRRVITLLLLDVFTVKILQDQQVSQIRLDVSAIVAIIGIL
jgi:hypothetical protein